MGESTLLRRIDSAKLDDGRVVSIHERESSHDMYVVVTNTDSDLPADLFEFPNEESAQEFFANLVAEG